MGMTAGAMVAGPVGAAVGGMLANMYEGEVCGRVEVGLRYTPIPCVSELQLLDTNLQFQRHDIKSRGDCRVWNGVK